MQDSPDFVKDTVAMVNTLFPEQPGSSASPMCHINVPCKHVMEAASFFWFKEEFIHIKKCNLSENIEGKERRKGQRKEGKRRKWKGREEKEEKRKRKGRER